MSVLPVITGRAGRRALLGLLLAAIATLFVIGGESVFGATKADAAGVPNLSCTGTTIFSLSRGGGGNSSGVFSLPTASVGGTSITGTSVASMPGTTPNGFGVGPNGASIWAVEQGGSGNTTSVYGWQASTNTWTTYTGAPSGGNNGNIVAGAVDPANNLFYYATFTGVGTGGASLFAFNITTDKPVGSGPIATFNLPGTGTAGQNGDLAFDNAGNLYYLNGQSANNSFVSVIPAANVPSTAPSGTPPSLTGTQISSFASGGNAYNGIAYDSDGYLYLEYTSGNSTYIKKINPNTGALVAGPTVISNVSAGVDLGSCASPPTVQLQKNLPNGRVAANDQFNLSITGGGLSSGNTATTTSTGSGLQTPLAGPVIGFAGTTYTFTESMASGSTGLLTQYNTTAACTDSANTNDTLTPSAVTSTGTSASFTLTVPTNTANPPAITCTFSNTPQNPAITIAKSASPTVVSTVGQTVTYSYLVTNTGSVPLSGITVNDAHAGLSAIQCPSSTLAVGAFETCTATYKVTQADLNAGSINNTATATGTPPTTTNGQPPNITSTPSTATVTVTQTPALSVVKSASPTVVSTVGSTVTYTFDVKNTGNQTLTNVGITDTQTAPAGGLASGPTCSTIVTGSGTCTTASGKSVVSSMAPGDEATFTATYKVTQADLDNGSINDSAVSTGTPPGGGTYTSPPSTAVVTATRTPSIEIVKSANVPSFSAPGVPITYSYVVTNNGNVTLHNVGVTDPMPGLSAVSCPSSTLAPGISETCTAAYTTTQADVNAGGLSNTGTASGLSPNNTQVTAQSSWHIPATQTPGLSILKSASPMTVSTVGSVVTYTFTVKNTGNVTMTNVGVTDTQTAPAGALTSGPTCHTIVTGSGTCTTSAGKSVVSSMAPGDQATFTATYTVTQADLDNGTINDSAVSTGTLPAGGTYTSAPSTAVVTATQGPAITLLKTASVASYSAAGTSITYSYLVTNTGNVTLHSVNVTDPMPGLSAIQCPNSSLAPTKSETCTATYTTTQADVDAGSLNNTGTATGLSPANVQVSAQSSVSIPAVQSPSLLIVKTPSPTTVSTVGATVTYTFTVTNNGNVTMHGVGVTDTQDAPAGALTSGPTCQTIVLGSGSCTTASGKSVVSSMAPGDEATFTATYTVTQADLNNGSIDDSAVATGSTPSNAPYTSPPSTAVVQAEQNQAITIVKSANIQSYSAPNTPVTYSYLVTNTGNVTLHNVTVTDPMPGLSAVNCPSTTLDVGDNETCTATYTTTQADVDAGSLNNTGTVTGLSPANVQVTAQSSLTIPATQSPAITLVKSASIASYSAPNTSVTYSYLVTNTGNVTLNPVTVTDPMKGLSAITCPDTSLAPTKSETCTATYTTTQADVDAGSLNNTGTATGTPPSGPNVTAQSSVSIPATQSAGLTITKTPSPTSVSTVGQTVTYTFDVKNSGNVTLTDVGVTDTQAAPAGALTSGPTCATIVSGSGSCTTASGKSVVSSMAPGDEATFTATYTVTQADLDHGSIHDSAVATGTTPSGGSETSQPATATVTATQSPAITLTKSASVASYSAPNTAITYYYLVTNTGNVTLDPVTVTDPMSGLSAITCPDTSLAPTKSETCTASYTTTQADVDAGSLNNTGTATGTPPSGNNVTAQSSVSIPASQTPGLTITKTPSPATVSAVGATVTYTFTVTNSGNVTMSNVGVTDTQQAPAGSLTSGPTCQTIDTGSGTCTSSNGESVVSSMAPGDKATFTATYTVTQADLDNGEIDDSAVATGTEPDNSSYTSDPATAKVTANQNPAITIKKSANLPSYSAANTIVTYSYLVTNTGNVTLHNVNVTDPMTGLSAVTCPDATLAPGANETCTATYSTTQADVDHGSISNTGTAHGTSPSGVNVTDQSSLTIPATQNPGLTIHKTAAPLEVTHVGQLVTYTFDVTNTGNETLTNVGVTDTQLTPGDKLATPPTCTTIVTGSGSCATASGQSIVTSMAPGDEAIFQATYVVNQTDMDNGVIKDSSVATGTTPQGDPEVSPPSTAAVTDNSDPAIQIVKSANVKSYSAAGQKVTYSYKVTNSGNVTLHTVKVTDPMKGLSKVSCPHTTLAPNASMTCTAHYTTTKADLTAGALHNTGTATGLSPNGQQVTARARLTIPEAAIKLVKSANVKLVTHAGQKVTYSYKVTNTGRSTLNPVVVTDPMRGLSKISCPKTQLAAGQSETCTATYTTTKSDLGRKTVNNTGTATGTKLGGGTVKATSSVKIPVANPVTKTFEVDTWHIKTQAAANRVTRSVTLPNFRYNALAWTWETSYGKSVFSGKYQVLRIKLNAGSSKAAWMAAVNRAITTPGVGKVRTTAPLKRIPAGTTTIAWSVPKNGWLLDRPHAGRAPHVYFASSR